MIKVLILVTLIVINGAFSASELAFLSMDKYTLRKKCKRKDKKALKIEKLLNNSGGFLSTIQICITLAGFLASAFAAETFADSIVSSLNITFMEVSTLKTIVVIIVTMILSYFTLVFGELVPKRLAMTYPEQISFGMVNIIWVIMKIFYPFVWLLTKSTNIVLKVFGVKKNEEEVIEEEAIKLMILDASKDGTIEKLEKDILLKVFEFNDTTALKAMTKMKDVVYLSNKMSNEEIIDVIRKSKFTRLPYYEDEKIIGILNVKNIIYSRNLELKKILHKVYYVNANEKIDDVFYFMRNRGIGMALVKNKDNEVVGIITVEDIVEEILGNIYDEYDSRDINDRDIKENN